MNLAVAFLFLELFFITAIRMISFCNGSSYMGCIESERKALLSFKQDLNDSSNRLVSWIGDGDCCKWAGVVCNNFTGYVIELNLRNPLNEFKYDDDKSEAYERSRLVGKMNPSLFDLKHLNHLDLSGNDFQAIQIPKYFIYLENLKYLNLSDTGLRGMVPYQLGNLSNLQYLDLSSNIFGLSIENFQWVSSLSSLKYLDLSSVDLAQATDLLLEISSLPSLKEVKLSDCGIQDFPPSSSSINSSLSSLDLSNNNFDNSLIPSWIFGLSNLVFFDISGCLFSGPIPNGLRNLARLIYLDLSDNQFNSTIPDWFSMFNGLEYLSLMGNSVQGTIPRALGNLTTIQTLDLSYNQLVGKIPTSFNRLCNLRSISISSVGLRQEISEVLDIFSECVAYYLESLNLIKNQFSGHLTNQLGQLRNLRSLQLSDNSITGPIPSSIGELSFLTYLDLSNNEFNGSIPSSLGKLSSLVDLHLLNNNLEGSIPFSLRQLSSLEYLDLSNNRLNGTNWVPPVQLKILLLSSCHLGSKFPSWLRSQKHLSALDISKNGISDIIPSWFWKFQSQIAFLNLSHNQIQGKIPYLGRTSGYCILDLSSNNLSGPLHSVSSYVVALDISNNALSGSISQFICHQSDMPRATEVLKLAENSFSGEIPDCWMNWPNLVYLNLRSNNFASSLPISMGTLSRLHSLNLRNNRLSGVIPEFKNCTKLTALDIGENEFAGNIPAWIGETFPRMTILNLRSNKFQGPLPTELCRLSFLQILDLASNKISGTIPRCINNFSRMVIMNYSADNAVHYPWLGTDQFIEDSLLVMKGVAVDYNYILNLVRSIDISMNYFSGQIPVELTDLGALQSLNLSYNLFSGEIPEKIGVMKSLESIDLSKNQLSGRIPQSMSSLTFLNYLNLSNNNLRGGIPLSTQLQSLAASCFTGNDLCGSPLPKRCTDRNVKPPTVEDENGDGDEVDYWLYASMALGFVVGFWCFIGPLLVYRRWRYMYCRFLDRLRDKFGCFV